MSRKPLKKSEFRALERKRVANALHPQEKILLVCEGAKTEPNYFKSIRRFLPPGLVDIDIFGEGMNTVSLVTKAIEYRDLLVQKVKSCPLTRPYDQCWAIFDRDSFLPEKFNSAIELGKQNNIKCAYTNEAFELWYLLHFEYLNAAINRDQYKAKLTSHIGFEYKKNSEEMYEILKTLGNETQAILFAQKLLDEHQTGTPATHNPSTMVHELIDELNALNRRKR